MKIKSLPQGVGRRISEFKQLFTEGKTQHGVGFYPKKRNVYNMRFHMDNHWSVYIEEKR